MKKHRYQWDKKVLLQVIISLVLGILFLQFDLWHQAKYTPEQLTLNDTVRWLHQFYVLVYAVSFFYCVLRLRKLFPNQLKKDIFNTLGWVFQKVGEDINKAVFAVRHLLGIPDPPKRTKAKDERSFVFDMEENDLVRRFKNMGGGLKWKDLDNNADKIRFIYIKFINKLMKKGYKFSPILTPLETLEKWKMQKDESAYMFPLYTVARYSGGRRPVTDEEVEKSTKYMKLNTKVG